MVGFPNVRENDSTKQNIQQQTKHTLQSDHVHLQVFIIIVCLASETRGVNEETQICEASLMRCHLKPFT